ncbi:hypothetical protein KC19_12G184100 [Ceratodon purpureus]|uniref:Uncharacterized protein n=1 Tax=Ceratodon purpureus TaxID=3225 RepID=A0A8T0GCS1_CERPU|nr:hypothetical protein KC19_12G184100 [Ceratodon purpureus]
MKTMWSLHTAVVGLVVGSGLMSTDPSSLVNSSNTVFLVEFGECGNIHFGFVDGARSLSSIAFAVCS